MKKVGISNFIFIMIFLSKIVNADDIAFGKIKGIKVYDLPTNQSIRIYFDDNATHKNETDCDGVAYITPGRHDEATVQKWVGIALAAQLTGRKIRAYSSDIGSCEAGLISIQDVYF